MFPLHARLFLHTGYAGPPPAYIRDSRNYLSVSQHPVLKLLPEAGKLTIAMTAQMEKCEVSVYSTDEEELYSHTEDCNENTKRVVASYEVYLTAGTYYIKVMEATAVLNL